MEKSSCAFMKVHTLTILSGSEILKRNCHCIGNSRFFSFVPSKKSSAQEKLRPVRKQKRRREAQSQSWRPRSISQRHEAVPFSEKTIWYSFDHTRLLGTSPAFIWKLTYNSIFAVHRLMNSDRTPTIENKREETRASSSLAFAKQLAGEPGALQAITTAFLALFCIVGLALWGLPYYYDFMVQQFGWTRAQVTSGNALSKLVVGPVFGFIAGWMVDRFGPRRLMMAGIPMAGAALVGLGSISTLGMRSEEH